MDIRQLIKAAEHPRPYDRGTAVMWTDPHIAKQLLSTHLNPDTDLASRRPAAIDGTIRWIHGQFGKNGGDLLDLGCGPGLYARRFAELGYRVTALDISQNSIDYAAEDARRTGLAVDYRCMDYLELDDENRYDLVILIYCDLGVLPTEDRDRLLIRIRRALRPGGVFLFDAFNPRVLAGMTFQKSWEMQEKGFWKDRPFLCLSESFHFPENKAFLDQYIVFDEYNEFEIYRFWNHYFTAGDVEVLARKAGFGGSAAHDFRLDGPRGEEVTFFSMTR